MNLYYRFKLEKGSKKYCCPICNKKTFVRYIDTEENNNYLPFKYGRCDRESNCNYNLNPYQDGYLKSLKINIEPQQVKKVKNMNVKKQTFFYPIQVLKDTLNHYNQNIFIQNLVSKNNIAKQEVEKVISLYYLGTINNGYRKGAITFPFIDINNNIRTIQAKQFNENNKTISTDFVHSVIEKHNIKNKISIPQWILKYNTNDLKVSCLFGEHLLNKYPNNPIALVEAPKTAIYGTLYFGFPNNVKNLIWLAVYNLSSLNFEKCKVLSGRKVVLFPDLSKNSSAYKLWLGKASELNKKLPKSIFTVSDYLEKYATIQDREKGKDLADFLINQDWKQFKK